MSAAHAHKIVTDDPPTSSVFEVIGQPTPRLGRSPPAPDVATRVGRLFSMGYAIGNPACRCVPSFWGTEAGFPGDGPFFAADLFFKAPPARCASAQAGHGPRGGAGGLAKRGRADGMIPEAGPRVAEAGGHSPAESGPAGREHNVEGGVRLTDVVPHERDGKVLRSRNCTVHA